MKDFNLERALAGEPVMTKSGKKVSEIYYFKSVNENLLPVVCIIEGIYHYYSIHGVKPTFGDDDDLCMAPIKKIVFVNVWANGYGIILSSQKPFETEKLAIDAYTANSFQKYYGAHPIEIEI